MTAETQGRSPACRECGLGDVGSPPTFYRDALVVATHMPGSDRSKHRIEIVTRRHRSSLAELTGDEAATIGRTANLAARAAEAIFEASSMHVQCDVGFQGHLVLLLVIEVEGDEDRSHSDIGEALDRTMFLLSV